MDDLHALDDAQQALQVVDTLVRSVSLSMRLYVLSRSWPQFPSLTRMVAQRRARSLTAPDLQFTDEEAIEFLRRSGVLDGASQSMLIRRADGWAAALAILVDHYDPSRAGGGTDATSEFVLSDFVEQEVLARLPDPSAQLLEACAVFRSFDIPLAQALSGNPDVPVLLREMERTNHLIVPLQDGEWFRMHALLREHLLDRVAVEEPERLRQLRRSAAALFARRGMRREAIQMALDAGDWPEAVQELHELREELYQRGEWATLAGWIDRLPADVIENDSDLLMMRARLALKTFDGQGGLARLDLIDDRRLTVEQQARRQLYRSVALRQINRLPDAIKACRRSRAIAGQELADESPLFGEIDLEEAIALGTSGQFAAAGVRFEAAIKAFERVGDHHRAAEAHDGFGTTLALRGSLAKAMEEFTAAQRRWRMLAEPQMQIATMNNIANVQYMLGELETARDAFNAVIQQAREIGQPRAEAYGHEGLAAVERDMGHLDTAESLYALAMQEAQEFDDPTLVAIVTFGLAMTHRERGELRRAFTLLEHGLRSAEQAGMLLEQSRCRSGVGATLLSEHRFQEAIPVLERAVGEAEKAGARREQALARLLLASARYQRRRRTEAIEELQQVHALVEELGYDQFLHAEARQMMEVTEYAAARRVGGEYFRGLCERVRAPSEAPEQEAALEDSGTLRIRAEVLGNPRVVLGRRQITDLEWRSERSREMFFLLLHSQRPLRKGQIALELWPDLSPKQVNSAFHSTLYRLRRAIDPQIVLQDDDGYQVGHSFDISYDAREFDDHTSCAEREAAGSQAWADHLTAAVRLYRGPFAEPFDSSWTAGPRRRYEDQYLANLLALATNALRRCEYDEVIALGESVIDADPLNEEAVRSLMQAHARSGHLDLAARAYRRLQSAVMEDLGEQPSASVQAVYQEVLSGAALDA